MKYYIGVDGGGSKTVAVVGDETGQVLGQGLAGPSNYQSVGMDAAGEAIGTAIDRALEAAAASAREDGPAPPGKGVMRGGLLPSVAAGAVFGLAGADYPVDFGRLNALCKLIMADRPFRVVNDAWVALRAGAREGMGVVCVNGTGANVAGRGPTGRTAILRGMGYEMGLRGGGLDILQEAMHHAFRANEATGPATALTQVIPKTVGFPSMEAIAEAMYAGKTSPAMGLPIVPVVFTLANEGDQVCQQILITVGTALGEAAGGVARRVGLDGMPFDTVLTGGVWKGENPLLRDAFTLALHRMAPQARPVLLEVEPAVGAYRMAVEMGGGSV